MNHCLRIDTIFGTQKNEYKEKVIRYKVGNIEGLIKLKMNLKGPCSRLQGICYSQIL